MGGSGLHHSEFRQPSTSWLLCRPAGCWAGDLASPASTSLVNSGNNTSFSLMGFWGNLSEKMCKTLSTGQGTNRMLNKGKQLLRIWTEILCEETLQPILNFYYLFYLICSTRKIPNCLFTFLIWHEEDAIPTQLPSSSPSHTSFSHLHRLKQVHCTHSAARSEPQIHPGFLTHPTSLTAHQQVLSLLFSQYVSRPTHNPSSSLSSSLLTCGASYWPPWAYSRLSPIHSQTMAGMTSSKSNQITANKCRENYFMMECHFLYMKCMFLCTWNTEIGNTWNDGYLLLDI